MRAMSASLSAATLVAAAIAFSQGAAATEGPRCERPFHPVPGVVHAPSSAATLDRLDEAPMATAARRDPARVADEDVYMTPDGSPVRISLSDGYAPDDAACQAVADFLGSLTHGRELAGLQVKIDTPSQLEWSCGAEAVACYFPSEHSMTVSGERSYLGIPTDFAIAHEYGHNIAAHQVNPPFVGGALTVGTKRWASHEDVCGKLRSHTISVGPGAYWDYPGEAFAETYAFSQITTSTEPWYYSPLLRPDPLALRLIRRDVTHPWTHDVTWSKREVVPRGGKRTFTVQTPLDGRLRVRLDAAPRAELDLSLLHGQRVVAASRRPGGDEHVSHLVCGERSFTASVTAARGGRFTLEVSRP
jgi:hypothetical protein